MKKHVEEIPLSDCCSEEMYDYPDFDICPNCGEHCEALEFDEGEMTPEETNKWLKSAGY